QSPRDPLPDPPGGIRPELVAQAVLVLVHGTHQAAVAFLDQVGEGQAPAAVTLGDGDHQPQVALGQLAAGLLVEPAPTLHRPRRSSPRAGLAGPGGPARTPSISSRSCLVVLLRRSRSAEELPGASACPARSTICLARERSSSAQRSSRSMRGDNSSARRTAL